MQFIKIDKDFKDLLRPLTADEYKSLEDSIKQDGCLRPIELWNGYIADGHNRYAICMKNKIPFEQADVTEKFETKSDVMKWIVQNQRARQTGRQLSKTELVKMALSVEKQVAVEAKENQVSAGGDRKSENAKSLSSNLNEPIRTASKAAESIGVSENTYRDMKLVAEKGSEEQIERMNQGGRGNAPSTIAKEIKGKSKTEEPLKCMDCGTLLTEENTYPAVWKSGKRLCKKCNVKRTNLFKKRMSDKYENMLANNDENYHMDFQDLEEEIVNIVSSAMDSVFSSINNYKQQGITATEKSIENIREKFSMLIATMKEMEEQNA